MEKDIFRFSSEPLMLDSRHIAASDHRRPLRGQRPELFLIWLIVLMGVLLPWLVGVSTKISLDLRGQPTWDWLYFLHPGRLLMGLWATFWLALPSLVLALLGRALFSNQWKLASALSRVEKWLLISTCAVWGAVASVKIFIEMFEDFDPVSLLVPFFWTVLYADDYVYGLLIGAAFVVLSTLGRKLFKGITHSTR